MDDVTAALMTAAWTHLRGDARHLRQVEVLNASEALLPSKLHAGPAMLAATCVSTLAASVLDGARVGRGPRRVIVDARQVSLAARSERFAHVEGSKPPTLFHPLSRPWRTSDGWVRLHTNYPWHLARAVERLRCAATPSAVEAAVLRWEREPLEEALAASGALGNAARTIEEWARHPQGVAVRGLPLLETRLGASGARGIVHGRAATGFRVLDLTRVIAGPVATRTLSAWGAEVLRLDSPGLPEIAEQTIDTLPGKRSAYLDFATREGRAQLEHLLSQADVLIQGYRPGALERFGLGVEELASRHPQLSVITVSAWGHTGPWARRRGFDSLVQFATGIAMAESDTGTPAALPAQVLDHATGYLAAAGAMLALTRRVLDGTSSSVRLSLAQTGQWLTSAGPAPSAFPDQGAPWPTTADSSDFLTLPGAGQPVSVIAPPGRIGDVRPTWEFTTGLGSDAPSFRWRSDGQP